MSWALPVQVCSFYMGGAFAEEAIVPEAVTFPVPGATSLAYAVIREATNIESQGVRKAVDQNTHFLQRELVEMTACGMMTGTIGTKP